MGLVDYSDSDSEPEVQPKAPPKESRAGNKPFQKIVDRSNPGKILVNLPTAAASTAAHPQQQNDEPPAKRARTTGGSRFSGFSSFLPPPKKTAATPAQSGSSSGKPAPRPGVHLKTGAERAFSREDSNNDDDAEGGSSSGPSTGGGGGLRLPPPKNHSAGAAAGPSIPEGQKPAEEVKLVGKPLMFKPLSVSRKPVKKKAFKPAEPSGIAASKPSVESAYTAPAPAPELPKKKISLFSLRAEADTSTPSGPSPSTGAYEPLFSGTDDTAEEPEPSYEDYSTPSYTNHPSHPAQPPAPQPSAGGSNPSLSAIANDLNLTPQARRELFGRDGKGGGRVVEFDMSREYEHNEAIRQSGEAVTHNPVRSIKAGKHSLRQLVNAVQSNAGALEESFAAQKGRKNEAGARYGWR